MNLASQPAMARLPAADRRPSGTVNSRSRVRRSVSVTASASVSELLTYPIKGLPPIRLANVVLERGGCLPADREWAIILGKHAHLWDSERPEKMFIDKGLLGMHHGTKVKFHQLITDEVLAAIELHYDFGTKRLGLALKGDAVEADLNTPEGVADAEAFFERMLGNNMRMSEDGATCLKLIRGAEGTIHQFGNVGGTQDKLLLHMVNLASVRDFEHRAGLGPVDPVRFRPNLIWDGGEAWEEWEWCGQRVRAGEAVLEFIEPTIRCPSTQVNPSTAQRDMQEIPKRLQELYPEAAATTVTGDRMALGGPGSRGGYMGVYARVVEPGMIRPGDAVMRA